MSQTTLYPVVMAGGSGSRLWPLSRVLYPKQFLCLKGDLTMLQTTVNRLHGVECESPVVICNEQHRFIVAEQLRQLNKLTENIILEPAGRNTAPAIALAALAAKRSSPDCDPLMLVLAADHVIQQEEAFRDAVRAAIALLPALTFIGCCSAFIVFSLRRPRADRLALSLVNRRQLRVNDFRRMDGGAVLLTDEARRTVLTAWQERKKEERLHPFLQEKAPFGLVPYLQAQMLARHLRGDLDAYPPWFWS